MNPKRHQKTLRDKTFENLPNNSVVFPGQEIFNLFFEKAGMEYLQETDDLVKVSLWAGEI